MSSEGIRIVVVDDQAVVRQGFVSLINTVPGMTVVAEGTNGRQAVNAEVRDVPVVRDTRVVGRMRESAERMIVPGRRLASRRRRRVTMVSKSVRRTGGTEVAR